MSNLFDNDSPVGRLLYCHETLSEEESDEGDLAALIIASCCMSPLNGNHTGRKRPRSEPHPMHPMVLRSQSFKRPMRYKRPDWAPNVPDCRDLESHSDSEVASIFYPPRAACLLECADDDEESAETIAPLESYQFEE